MHWSTQSENPAWLITPLEKPHSVKAGNWSGETAVRTPPLLRKVTECGVVQVSGQASWIGSRVSAEQLGAVLGQGDYSHQRWLFEEAGRREQADEAFSPTWTKSWSWSDPRKTWPNPVRKVTWAGQSSLRMIRGLFSTGNFWAEAGSRKMELQLAVTSRRAIKTTTAAILKSDDVTVSWEDDGDSRRQLSGTRVDKRTTGNDREPENLTRLHKVRIWGETPVATLVESLWSWAVTTKILVSIPSANQSLYEIRASSRSPANKMSATLFTRPSCWQHHLRTSHAEAS